MVPIGSRKHKQQKQQKLILDQEEKIDLYSFSFSLIFHIFLFLVMTLIYGEAHKKPVIVSISFENTSQDIAEFDLVNIEDDLVEASESEEIIIDAPQDHAQTKVELEYYDDISQSSALQIEPIEDILTELKVKTSHITKTPVREADSTSESDESNKVLSDLMNTVSAGVIANANQRHRALADGAGIGGDMEMRLKNAGAKVGDITISIAWDTVDDIDLHVIYAAGNGLIDKINWTNKIGRLSGGMLDVDMNANYAEIVRHPVENIFWPPNSSPKGSFIIYIHFYRSWSGNNRVPVKIRLKRIGHQDSDFNMVAIWGSQPQEVTSFQNSSPKKAF